MELSLQSRKKRWETCHLQACGSYHYSGWRCWPSIMIHSLYPDLSLNVILSMLLMRQMRPILNESRRICEVMSKQITQVQRVMPVFTAWMHVSPNDIMYLHISTRKTQPQCVSNGVTIFLHEPIDLSIQPIDLNTTDWWLFLRFDCHQDSILIRESPVKRMISSTWLCNLNGSLFSAWNNFNYTRHL